MFSDVTSGSEGLVDYSQWVWDDIGWQGSLSVEGPLCHPACFVRAPKILRKGSCSLVPSSSCSPSSLLSREMRSWNHVIPCLEPVPAQDTALGPGGGNETCKLWVLPTSPATSPSTLHVSRMASDVCSPQESAPLPGSSFRPEHCPSLCNCPANLSCKTQRHLLPQAQALFWLTAYISH